MINDAYNADENMRRSYDLAIAAVRERLLAGRELVDAAKEGAVIIAVLLAANEIPPQQSPELIRLVKAIRAFSPHVEPPPPAAAVHGKGTPTNG